MKVELSDDDETDDPELLEAKIVLSDVSTSKFRPITYLFIYLSNGTSPCHTEMCNEDEHFINFFLCRSYTTG